MNLLLLINNMIGITGFVVFFVLAGKQIKLRIEQKYDWDT